MVRRKVDTTHVKLTCARLVAVDSQKNLPQVQPSWRIPTEVGYEVVSSGRERSLRDEWLGYVVTRQRVTVVSHTPNKTHVMHKRKTSHARCVRGNF